MEVEERKGSEFGGPLYYLYLLKNCFKTIKNVYIIQNELEMGRLTSKNFYGIWLSDEFKQTPGDSEGREAWCAAVHGVAKSWTRLSDFTFTFHFPALEKEIPGTGEPGGLPSMGSHRMGHD